MDHYTPESMVITELMRISTPVTECWDALDSRGAEDALNATLGQPRPIHGLPKSELSARAQLTLSSQARADAEQYHEDRTRMARLRYLKEQLYSDPEMVLLEHLERRPGDIQNLDIKDFQRLSRSLRVGGSWWYPLLDCLEALSEELPKQHGDLIAMKLLLKAFKDTLPDLIDKHGLRDLADQLLKDSEPPSGSPRKAADSAKY
ncbi:hypothetical protein [Streptomyces hygroscopicus]|uniref:hypothetical protein n=1 Tax=Streptomyces hygroscopicus TaxID=1912 RepID=UPI0011AE8ED3|nr:hypothetical protein [Streptomyces sp. NBRC 109436]